MGLEKRKVDLGNLKLRALAVQFGLVHKAFCLSYFHFWFTNHKHMVISRNSITGILKGKILRQPKVLNGNIWGPKSSDPNFSLEMDREKRPVCKAKLTTIFKTKTRDEWCEIMEGTDACFAPVLTLSEAPKHPHNLKRQTFVKIDGVVQPAPMPRFSRTAPEIQKPPSPHY